MARVERGLLVTCLWYIGEVDPQSLLLTGLTRDGVYLIENGEVLGAVNNFRFNESPVDLMRRFSHASATAPTSRRVGRRDAPRTAMPALRVPDFNMSTVSAGLRDASQDPTRRQRSGRVGASARQNPADQRTKTPPSRRERTERTRPSRRERTEWRGDRAEITCVRADSTPSKPAFAPTRHFTRASGVAAGDRGGGVVGRPGVDERLHSRWLMPPSSLRTTCSTSPWW